jgi:protein-S-isoprenylcysteine O-methyltransferase Ste14
MEKFIFQVVVILWPISEIILAFIKKSKGSKTHDQSKKSFLAIWVVISLSLTIVFISQGRALTRLPLSDLLLARIGLFLIVLGLIVRWSAIRTMGKFFSVSLTVQEKHKIIDHGLYRYIRHPSYSGMIVSFAGLGIALGTWLSLIVLSLPISAVLIHRMVIEESDLLDNLGDTYKTYRKKTKRIIPWIY